MTDSKKFTKKISTETKFKKTSALEDGQSIEGTLLSFQKGKIPGTDKEVTNLVMKDASGQSFNLAPSGNIVYAIRDNLLEVGQTYKFQKEGTRRNKRGQLVGVFGIYTDDLPTAARSNDDI